MSFIAGGGGGGGGFDHTTAFTVPGGNTARSLDARLTIMVNVLDHGADRTGATDSTAAIQASINAAAALPAGSYGGPGGTVYVPTGSYQITAPLTNFNNINSAVSIMGDGANTTKLYGHFNGFIIDQNGGYGTPARGYISFGAQPAANSTITLNGTVITFVTGTPTGNQVQIGANLAATVTSLRTFCSGSADVQISKCNYATDGSPIQVLQICYGNPNPASGLGVAGNTFTLAASTSPASNATVSGATLSGGNAIVGNPGHFINISGLTVANSYTDICTNLLSGAIRFTTAILGNCMSNLSLGGWTCLDAGFNNFQNPIVNVVSTGAGGGQVSGQAGYGSIGAILGNVNTFGCSFSAYATGAFTVNTNTGLYSFRTETCNVGLNLGTDPTGMTGNTSKNVTITSYSTERCNTGVIFNTVTGVHVSSSTVTGTRGPGQNATATPTWSAGLLTVVSDKPIGFTGTTQVYLDGFGGSVAASNPYTATFVNSTTFTVPFASNPGAANGGTWSLQTQYGMQFLNPANVSLHDVTLSGNMQNAGFDFSSLQSNSFTLFDNCIGISWSLPTSTHSAQIACFRCDNPSLAFPFQYVPGQAGSGTTPSVGDQYEITNGPGTPTFGMVVTNANLASTPMRVRWNGTAWTVVGI